MAPIKGISDARWMPRLGRIRLGIMIEPDQGNPYPRPVDYFVCPPEVQAVFKEKPKELRIMFPVEDETKFAPQFYRCYSQTWGLVCRGDGVTADRSVDTVTGDLASRGTKEVKRVEMTCPGPNCPELQKKQCRPVLSLMFLLPEVPGLGVWQINTSSFYSIRNINSGIDLARELCGRVSMIPLLLSRVPTQVTPEGERKKTIHILYLSSHVTLADIQRAAALPPARVLMPPPGPPEEEEAPEDLFPETVLGEAEAASPPPAPPPPPPPADPRLEGWRIARDLVKKLRPKDSAIRAWWEPKGAIITLADFDQPAPPEGVTAAHLSAFVDALQAGKQTRMV